MLSGYLITDLLIAEYRRHRGIGLKQFWIRRARRLLPALFVMLFVTVGLGHPVRPEPADRPAQRPPVRDLLLEQLVVHLPPRLLLRQVRPALAARAPVVAGHRGAVLSDLAAPGPASACAGSTRSGPWCCVTLAPGRRLGHRDGPSSSSPGGDPTRVYDGTDTRAFALLIGAALAMVLPRSRTFAPVTAQRPPAARRWSAARRCSGSSSCSGTPTSTSRSSTRAAWCCWPCSPRWSSPSPSTPGPSCGRSSGGSPCAGSGERSYAIYLWHYPVIVLTTPLNAPPSVVRALLQIAATSGHRRPVLALHRAAGPPRRARPRSGSGSAEPPVVVAPAPTPVGWVLVGGRRRQRRPVRARPVRGGVGDRPPTRRPRSPASCPRPPPAPSTTTPPCRAARCHHHHRAPAGRPGRDRHRRLDHGRRRPLPPAAAARASPSTPRWASSSTRCRTRCPSSRPRGRWATASSSSSGPTGPTRRPSCRTCSTPSGPCSRIVLVNTRVPRPWQQQVNQTIATVAQPYPNATVVDWYADSAAYPQYFYPDGVHLDPAGAKYYASLLVQALEAPVPPGHCPEPGQHARRSAADPVRLRPGATGRAGRSPIGSGKMPVSDQLAGSGRPAASRSARTAGGATSSGRSAASAAEVGRAGRRAPARRRSPR